MLEEKTQDLMVNMQAVLPLIVTNALNALGAIVILLIGLDRKSTRLNSSHT